MNCYQTTKSKYFTLSASTVLKTALYLAPMLLCSVDAMAFNLDGFFAGPVTTAKEVALKYYPVGIFLCGLVGAFLERQGDLRDKMLGFGKGSVIAGLVVTGAKAGFGI